MFKDRYDAALKLAAKLKKYKASEAIILAIPRGGLEIGYVLAQALAMPLEVILIKKLSHPANKELAIGAVSLYGRIINKNTNVSEQYMDEETQKIQELLRERQRQYENTRNPKNLEGKVVILVDDGVATGHTMFTAIDVVKNNNPKKIVVAVPVAPKVTVVKLASLVDEVVCEEIPLDFYAVGQFYRNFSQTRDEDALSLFRKANKEHIET